jgi:hypothetical protein
VDAKALVARACCQPVSGVKSRTWLDTIQQREHAVDNEGGHVQVRDVRQRRRQRGQLVEVRGKEAQRLNACGNVSGMRKGGGGGGG